ncbi:unnamed protein product [Ixodes hexagonus]
MAAVSDRCHGEADISSLPQGWHPMNGVSVNAKAPASATRSSTNSTTPKPLTNGPAKTSSDGTPNGKEARTRNKHDCIHWSGRTPSNSATARATTDKLRQEASTEKLRQEAAALQKKVAQFRVENQSLKTKVKRLEEECLRKTRQVDKLTMLSKEKSAVAQDKKKEDDVLKQKCMKLEVQLREKEDKLRKLQSSQKNQSESADKPQPTRSRLSLNSHGGTSAELIKLREQIDRLSQDNRRLALQIKEKDQEMRRLKSQANPQPSTLPRAATASRSQRPASSSRARSTSEAKRVATAKRSDTFSVSRSQMAALSNGPSGPTPPGGKQTEVVKKRKQEELSTSSSSSLPKEKLRGTKQQNQPKPPETNPQVERVKRNVAAKKIQRGWRNYRKRKSSDASTSSIGSLKNASSTVSKRRTSTGSAGQPEE